jgi:hypothetical protein
MKAITEVVIQGDIEYRDSDHTYVHIPTLTKLASVSKVIQTVYSTKSWDGVKPEIIEKAAFRGKTVDKYFSEFVNKGTVDVPRGEDDLERDIENRIYIACNLFDQEFCGLKAEAQKIVYNLEDGIAGTMDAWVGDRIVVDLKSTYNAEKSWILQLGAYADYAPGLVERIGIIHISPKVYSSGGVWMEYNVDACRTYWRDAVAWWKKTCVMAKAKISALRELK